MQSFRRRLSISFPALFVLTACGTGVNVGGPQDTRGADAGTADAAGPKTEAGSPSSSSSSPGPQPSPPDSGATAACSAVGGTCVSASTGCSSPQDPSLIDACGDPNVLKCCVPYTGPPPSTATADAMGLEKARGYASGNVACTTDADCCVAFDGCVNEALVVGVADKGNVAMLLAGFDAWANGRNAPATCTGCIPPPVQVSCVQQKCTGLELNTSDFKNPMSNPWVPWLTDHCGTIAGAPTPRSSGSILGCGGPPPATLSFKNDIMPIFRVNCAKAGACHNDPSTATNNAAGGGRPYLGTAIDGGAETTADIAMVYVGLFKPSFEYVRPHINYITPGDPTMSYLMFKMDPNLNMMYDTHCASGDFAGICGLPMPSDQIIPLDQATRDRVRNWISQGALNN